MNIWHCDYCGHQQDAAARKCADCGGPRGEQAFDPYKWPGYDALLESHISPDWDEYQQYLTGERIKAQKALTDALVEVGETIRGVFLPVLENL